MLTPSELVRAIEAALDPWRVPIALAAYCGLRQAELLGLKWDAIDWVGGAARIRRTQRGGVFSKPKSTSSRRTIELPAPLTNPETPTRRERSNGRTHERNNSEWVQNGY